MASTYEEANEEVSSLIHEIAATSLVTDTYPWQEKQAHLTELLSNFNTLALERLRTLTGPAHEAAQGTLDIMNVRANKAFDRIARAISDLEKKQRATASAPDKAEELTSKPVEPPPSKPIRGKRGEEEIPGPSNKEEKTETEGFTDILREIQQSLKLLALNLHPPRPRPRRIKVDVSEGEGTQDYTDSESDLEIVGADSEKPKRTPKPRPEPTPAPAPIQSCSNSQPIPQLKFDRVTLSTFDGKIINWIPFRDEFLEYVHTNKNLGPGMKFHQLKTHLSGIALEAIRSFSNPATDYDSAWELLLERYNNETRIVNGYMAQFFALPHLEGNPSSNDYLTMINRTTLLLRAMPSFGYNVNSWDPIIMNCLIERLDNFSVRKWTDQIKKREKIPLSELLEFLEIQASERLLKRPEPTKPQHKKAQPRPRVMVATQSKKDACIICGTDNTHPIYLCPTFRKLTVQARIGKISDAKHCLRCLRKHPGEKCTFRMCRTCDSNHNDMLCYKAEKARNGTFRPKEENQLKPGPSSSPEQ